MTPPKDKKLDFLNGQPFAHRGLHDEGQGRPENSLAAFGAAIGAGYPIELDVQLSADGQAMIFHDQKLDRMTGTDGLFGEMDAAALGLLCLGDSGETIPSLAEALDLIAGQVAVIVEIKSAPGQIGAVEQATLDVLRGYGGAFAVTSFEARSLTWFRQREPQCPRGQNVGTKALATFEPWWRRLAWEFLYDVDGARPDFVVYDRLDLPHWAATRIRAAGTPILSYTIRDADEMNRLSPHTDNIIFEGFRP